MHSQKKSSGKAHSLAVCGPARYQAPPSKIRGRAPTATRGCPTRKESIRSMIAGMKRIRPRQSMRLGAWAIFFLAWYSMKTMMGTTSQPCS